MMSEFILEDEAMISCYQINTYWSEDDKAYIAEILELPGCLSDGLTESEARRNIQLIAQEWLDTARLLGRPIPQPARETSLA